MFSNPPRIQSNLFGIADSIEVSFLLVYAGATSNLRAGQRSRTAFQSWSVLVLAVMAEQKSFSGLGLFWNWSVKQKVACCLCAKQLTYKPDGGTGPSNLLKHMSAVHASVWNKSKAKRESEKDVFSSNKRGTLDSFVKKLVCPASRAGQLTDAIVDMVALDLRSATIVESIGFRRLMQVAETVITILLCIFSLHFYCKIYF